jgi:hypothetical protein
MFYLKLAQKKKTCQNDFTNSAENELFLQILPLHKKKKKPLRWLISCYWRSRRAWYVVVFSRPQSSFRVFLVASHPKCTGAFYGLPLCILSGLGFGKLPTLHFFIVCCETQLMQEDFDIHTDELFCPSWLYVLNLHFYILFCLSYKLVFFAYEVYFFQKPSRLVLCEYISFAHIYLLSTCRVDHLP